MIVLTKSWDLRCCIVSSRYHNIHLFNQSNIFMFPDIITCISIPNIWFIWYMHCYLYISYILYLIYLILFYLPVFIMTIQPYILQVFYFDIFQILIKRSRHNFDQSSSRFYLSIYLIYLIFLVYSSFHYDHMFN